MARKRGGIAGVWDRNKKWLNYVAPVAAGVVGGPWAGAALGAAMRGLDRPGKSGIGLDLGQAARGGIEGYGLGKLGAVGAAKAGLGTPAAKKIAEKSAAKIASPAISGGGGGGVKESAGRFAKYLDVANKNSKVLEMAGRGIMSQLPDPQAQQQLELGQQRIDLERQQFAATEAERERERLRRERMSQLLMPVLTRRMDYGNPPATNA